MTILMQTIMDPLPLLFSLLLFFNHAHSICVPRNSSHQSIPSSPNFSAPPDSLSKSSPPPTITTPQQEQTESHTTTNVESTNTNAASSPTGDSHETSTNTNSATQTAQTPPPLVESPAATKKSPTEPTDSPTEPTDSPDSPTPTMTMTKDSLAQPTGSPDSPTPTEPTDSPDSPTPTTDSPDSPIPTTDSITQPTDSPDSPTPTMESPTGTMGTSPFEHHSLLFPSITNLVKPDPAIQQICAKTDYPDLCGASISPLFNGKSDVTSVLEISIKACEQYAKVAIAAAKQIVNSHLTPTATVTLLGGCTEMFSDALYNLQKATEAMANHDVATLNIMLSAAISDFTTCEDEFEGQRSLLSSYDTKLSNMAANCLAIASMI